nr:helix-turn-helix transcriptional regulator [uncultured Oscillibacter sp.]
MENQESVKPTGPTIEGLRNAWSTGVERGHDITQSKTEQRLIIAKRVKALRMEKGISQEKFSEAINANFLTYKGYENCKSDIPIFYLVRIADILGTTLDYLAGRTDVKDTASIEERLKRLEEKVLGK